MGSFRRRIELSAQAGRIRGRREIGGATRRTNDREKDYTSALGERCDRVSVRGHEKVPGYGQLMSPLVARKVPASGH